MSSCRFFQKNLLGAFVSVMLHLKARATNWRIRVLGPPAIKRNRTKMLQLFTRLLEVGLLRPRPKGTPKLCSRIFFVNKGEKQKNLILGSNCELVIRVTTWRQ